nr:hypothetical protein [uncultured bacterium]
MTLCGDLLNLPLDITFTRLRAVRRKGVNEHGPVQMSGGEREIFFGLMKRSGMAPGYNLHPFESRSPQGRKRARPGADVRG